MGCDSLVRELGLSCSENRVKLKISLSVAKKYLFLSNFHHKNSREDKTKRRNPVLTNIYMYIHSQDGNKADKLKLNHLHMFTEGTDTCTCNSLSKDF